MDLFCLFGARGPFGLRLPRLFSLFQQRGPSRHDYRLLRGGLYVSTCGTCPCSSSFVCSSIPTCSPHSQLSPVISFTIYKQLVVHLTSGAALTLTLTLAVRLGELDPRVGKSGERYIIIQRGR